LKDEPKTAHFFSENISRPRIAGGSVRSDVPAFDQEDLEPYLYVESQTKKLPVCFKFCFFADKLLFKSHFVFGGEKYVSFLKSVANRFSVIK
jgi:hypothetical protein